MRHGCSLSLPDPLDTVGRQDWKGSSFPITYVYRCSRLKSSRLFRRKPYVSPCLTKACPSIYPIYLCKALAKACSVLLFNHFSRLVWKQLWKVLSAVFPNGSPFRWLSPQRWLFGKTGHLLVTFLRKKSPKSYFCMYDFFNTIFEDINSSEIISLLL